MDLSALAVFKVLIAAGTRVRKKNALRCLLTFWYLTVLLLYTGYTAGFTKDMSEQRHTKPLNDLEDMLERGTQWGGVRNDTYFLEYFNQRQLVTYPSEIHGDRFISNIDTLDDYAKKHLKAIKCFKRTYSGLVISENLGLRSKLDTYIERYTEYGLFQEWMQFVMWWGKNLWRNI